MLRLALNGNYAFCFQKLSFLSNKTASASARLALEPDQALLGGGSASYSTKDKIKQTKMSALFYTPGDGFEPPLEEPESSVLPLDDPGTHGFIILQIKKTRKKSLFIFSCVFFIID